MILYHGTIGNRGKKIIQDGRIKHDAPLIWDKDISCAVISTSMLIDTNTRTTPDYVYLSDELVYAVHYAVIAAMNESVCPECYIFKMDIEPEELLADKDDLALLVDAKYRNISVDYKESLTLCNSVCIDHDVVFDEVEVEYIKFIPPLFDNEPLEITEDFVRCFSNRNKYEVKKMENQFLRVHQWERV